MNRKRKIKQMRKFINKYGKITTEYKRPKDKFYRKGSYFAQFNSDILSMSVSVEDIDQYHVYKFIVNEIKKRIKKGIE